MAEHHALGLAGGAGGVEDGRDVEGRRAADLAVAGVGGAFRLDEAQIADGYDESEPLHRRFAQFGKLLLGDEYCLRLGVGEDVLDFVRGELGQHRHRDAAIDGGREEGGAPVRGVLREYRHLVSRPDAEVGEYPGNIVAAVPELCVGIALTSTHELGGRPSCEGGHRVLVEFSKSAELRLHLEAWYWRRPSARMCRAFSSSGTSST